VAVLVDRSSRVVIQGMTGSIGRVFADRMLRHGTRLVAGVTPGKGGSRIQEVPVFDTVARAVMETRCTHSLIVVPPLAVLDAVMEAADAGIQLSIVYADGVPVHDAMRGIAYARARGMLVCGPNSAGIVSVGQANMSDLNDENLFPGPIGIVSKSGTITYEIILELQRRGFGVSTVVCLGGDPIVGLDYYTVVEQLGADRDTAGIVLVGEIGGRAELGILPLIPRLGKPLVAYIAGRYAPLDRKMGHAGAIIREKAETADDKLAELEAVGVLPARLLPDVAPLMVKAIGEYKSV